MSKMFAIVVDGKVTNTVIYDSLESAQQDIGEGATAVEIIEGVKNPTTGDTWDGENFHPAPVVATVIEEMPAEPAVE